MDDQVVAHPLCIDCGYDLHGLGEAARCPECGRVNVPEAFRREMWDLVDGGTRFFSNPLRPFRKRPPGWWWSLDRPGDVRRSFRYAAACVTLSALSMCLAVTLGDSLACEAQCSYKRLRFRGSNSWQEVIYESRIGLLGVWSEVRVHEVEIPAPERVSARPPFRMSVGAIRFRPRWGSVLPALLIVPALLATWFGPALVGLCTQIRKGLPRFARAPATVVAGCNYEAHRLVYVAILVVVWVLLDVLIRRPVAQWSVGRRTPVVEVIVMACCQAPPFLIMLYGALGWVGALRSDFTRMLIRSRWHAVRIVLMYTIGLPLMTAFVAASILALLGAEGF